MKTYSFLLIKIFVQNKRDKPYFISPAAQKISYAHAYLKKYLCPEGNSWSTRLQGEPYNKTYLNSPILKT